MLQECQNPFIEYFSTAYELLREVATVDPTVHAVTTVDWSSLLACLIALCNTRTENVPTTSEIGGMVVGTAYSTNMWDIVLRLKTPADSENCPLGL